MRRLFCVLIVAATPALAGASEPSPLRGVVLDAQTGRPLQGALVSVPGSAVPSVSTSSAGTFVIPAPSAVCSLTVRLAGYTPATIQGAGVHDSLLHISLLPALYAVDEVVVQASRIRLDVSRAVASVNIIDRREIESAPVTTLAGILVTAPGLFVKNYGGGSGLKSISQRGLGAEHTAILLNGLPVNSARNGIMDLGMTPLEDLERIEVLHGGSSLSFGSQAVGGVVNLVSRAPASEPAVRAGLTLGSFGYERYAVAAGMNVQAGAFRLSYLQEGADDDYRFVFHDGPSSHELHRSNSDFLSRSLSLRGALATGMSTVIDVYGVAMASDRGVAGAVVSPSSSSSARQTDTDVLLQAGVRHSFGQEHLLEARAQARNASQQYSDPSLVIAGVPLDNQYRNREYRIEPRYESQATPWLRYAAGGTAAVASADGDITNGSVSRTDWAMYAQARASIEPSFSALGEAYITGGARYDRAGHVDATSPSIGVGLRSARFQVGPLTGFSFLLRGAVNRSFRAPTFNELFYQGGGGRGNSALRPEHGSGGEAGATVAFTLWGDHTLDASFFSSSVNDRIIWAPAGPGIVSPRNLRRVEAEGYELSYAMDINSGSLRMKVHYGNALAVNAAPAYPGDPFQGKTLIYVPRETGGASLSFVHRPSSGLFAALGGTVWYAMTGPRYMSEDNLDVLPMYDVLDVALSASTPLWDATMHVRCEINNVLNEDYQVIRGYPMPLRTVRFGLAIQY